MVRLGILIIVEQILENQGWSLLSVYHISVARTGMTSKEIIEHKLRRGASITTVKLCIQFCGVDIGNSSFFIINAFKEISEHKLYRGKGIIIVKLGKETNNSKIDPQMR